MSRDHDPDMFGYFDVKDLVEKSGIVSWKRLWYKIPRSDEFRMIESDKEVMEMLSFLTPFIGLVHIYVEDESREDHIREDGGPEDNERGGGPAVEDSNDLGEGTVVEDNEGNGEEDYDDDNEEDSDYNQPEVESSDDSLEDADLASGDGEYLASREQVAAARGQRQSFIDMHDAYRKWAAPECLSEYEESVEMFIPQKLTMMMVLCCPRDQGRHMTQDVTTKSLIFSLDCDLKMHFSVEMQSLTGI